VSTAPLVLVVHPSVPGNDVKSLIDYAKSKPDGLLYGSAGPGSLGHLSTELFAERAGIKLNHVPYKGQAPSTMGTLAGEVSILLSSASATTYDFAKEGKLKILGVSSAKPSPVVPGARPIGETLPGFEVNIWFGILGPAGIPAPVVAKLQAALVKTLADPTLKERFLAFGVEATSSTSAELGAIMAKEAPEWKKVIEQRNIKGE
jgi:tripartite-type tricarboxylate transporter receptor subunit TctC